MMFWALAASVCLSVFSITWVAGLVAIRAAAGFISRFANSAEPRAAANCVFAARVAPFFIALAASVGFALPAFLRFEPRMTDESLGLRLWILAGAGLTVLVIVVFRAFHILRNTRWMERNWRTTAVPIYMAQFGICIPSYLVEGTSSLVAVAGIFRPRIYFSSEVARRLTGEELSAALAHEIAHVGFFDNLRQWMLKISQPPRWLDTPSLSLAAWAKASELSADDGALRSGASPLDLAAALLKVARLQSSQPIVSEGIAVSHLVPTLPDSCLHARVERLFTLSEEANRNPDSAHPPRTAKIFLIGLSLALYLTCLNTFLALIHNALERLVS